MILLSNIIKSHWAASVDQQKIIAIKTMQSRLVEESPQHYLEAAEEKKEMIARAQMEAEKILKEAKRLAESIHKRILDEKEAWEQEKAVLIEEARRAGFSKGLIEGKDQGYKEYNKTIEFAREVVTNAKKDYQHQVESAEKTILQIGLEVAGKILGGKLDNEEGFLMVVKRALKEAREYHDVQIQINPCHYGFLLSRKEELKAVFPNERDLYIYPNDDLSENSCIIESANGRIDASVDNQLEEMKRKLIELLESEV
jgi:flagellar assembly protein FliH